MLSAQDTNKSRKFVFTFLKVVMLVVVVLKVLTSVTRQEKEIIKACRLERKKQNGPYLQMTLLSV
jgi:hypothetical protein